uniref:Uncharacterized protein n=1 Tax=Cacopsylla melanoneura TaxID=428564 RepID=A0A8D8RK73_9HEMI
MSGENEHQFDSVQCGYSGGSEYVFPLDIEISLNRLVELEGKMKKINSFISGMRSTSSKAELVKLTSGTIELAGEVTNLKKQIVKFISNMGEKEREKGRSEPEEKEKEERLERERFSTRRMFQVR